MNAQPPADDVKRVHVVLAALFIFASSMMTFVNAVDTEFVNWGDDVHVTQNPHVRQLTAGNLKLIFSETYFLSWIPLTVISHAADVAVWGMNAKGHHFTNVLLHGFNAVWIFLTGLLLFRVAAPDTPRSDAGALTPAIVLGSGMCALLYAMHPLRIEPVVWVSGRKELLCVFFLAPAFYAYLSWKLRRRILPLVLAHVFFAGALLSKPAASVFPLLLVLVDMWWMKKRTGGIQVLHTIADGKVLMWGMSLAVVVVTAPQPDASAVAVLEDLSSVERAFFPAYAIMFYVWKTFAPFELSPIYPDVNKTLMHLSPLAVVLTVHAVAVLAKRRHTGFSVAFLAFVILLIPSFLGLAAGLQPVADRYTYLAAIPLFLFFGACGEWVWRKTTSSSGRLYQREAIFIVLFIFCGINAYRSIRHISIWNTSVLLWRQATLYAPKDRQEYQDRKPYFKPDYIDAMTKLGEAYLATGRVAEAAVQFRTAVALSPAHAGANYRLGALQAKEGSIDSAKVSLRTAIALEPTLSDAHYELGLILADEDSADAALAAFRAAARKGNDKARKLLTGQAIGW